MQSDQHSGRNTLLVEPPSKTLAHS